MIWLRRIFTQPRRYDPLSVRLRHFPNFYGKCFRQLPPPIGMGAGICSNFDRIARRQREEFLGVDMSHFQFVRQQRRGLVEWFVG